MYHNSQTEDPRLYKRGWDAIRKPIMQACSMAQNNTGMMLIAASQCFFSLMYVSVKILNSLDPPIPTFELIWFRMGTTWLCCIAYMYTAKIPDPFLGPKGVRILLALRGVAGFISILGVYYSLAYLSLSDATVLTFLVPLCTAVTAALFLGEELSWKQVIAGVCSLLGVVLIARPHFIFQYITRQPDLTNPVDDTVATQHLLGIGCALIGVLGATGAYTTIHAIGKRAHPLHNPAWYSSQCVMASTIAGNIPMLCVPVVFPARLDCLALLLVIGIFGFAAQILLTLGLQLETAGRETMAIYVQIVFATVFELIFFHTTPSPLSILGMVAIIASAIYVAVTKEKVQKVEQHRDTDDTTLEEGLLALAHAEREDSQPQSPSR